MLVCPVIVTFAAVFIAYQEAQQTKYQRSQHCISRFVAGFENNGADNTGSRRLFADAQRRCYGLPPTPTTTIP